MGFIKQTQVFCHDFETSSLEYYNPDEYPTILGMSFQPGFVYILPLGHKDSPFLKDYVQALEYIGYHLCENKKIVKIGWNTKFEQKWFLRYGITYQGRVFDAMLAKYLLDEEKPFGLKENVIRFEPLHANYEDENNNQLKNMAWKDIPMDILSKYCAMDVDMTLKLMIRFENKLIQNDFYKLFRSEKMPLSTVLANAEFNGILIDKALCNELVYKYQKMIDDNTNAMLNHPILRRYVIKRIEERKLEYISKLQAEIEELESKGAPARAITPREEKVSRIIANNPKIKNEHALYEPFNFDSPKQLVELLYTSSKGFKFPIIEFTKKDKRPTSTPSTSEDTLQKLEKKVKKKRDKEFLSMILKNRELRKLHSTYIVGIRDILTPENRIHTSFLIHGTVTGRLSSTKPNVQNVPRVLTNPDVKRMFIPPPGKLIVELDYGQAELRVLAEITKDPVMIDIFKQGYNIHVATACKMFNGDYDKVKAIIKDPHHPDNEIWERRKKIGKSMNFSIIYLQGDRATAEGLGCSIEDAKKFKKEWFASFPKVKPWLEKQFKKAYHDGYVKTLLGQKRRLPNIYSPVEGLKFEALRQSVNAPIQGVSGQYTNISNIVIREYQLQGKLPKDMQLAWTVHDSIGLYVNPEDIHHVVNTITHIMENPETLHYFGYEMKMVKMKASAEVGRTWASLEDYDKTKDYTKLL